MAEQKLDDVLGAFGISPDEIEAPIISGKSVFYQHQLGDFEGMILEFKEKCIDPKTKKSVEKGTPGSKSFGMLRIIILKDPKQALITNRFELVEGIKYGRLIYNIYIDFNPEKQYQNKNNFTNFFVDNYPQLSIVQGTDNDYKINLRNLIIYYGAPVTFTLTKTLTSGSIAKNAFIKNGTLKLKSNKISKEIVEKRKKAAAFLIAQLDELQQQEETERNVKKVQSGNAEKTLLPLPDSTDDGADVLSNYSGLGGG